MNTVANQPTPACTEIPITPTLSSELSPNQQLAFISELFKSFYFMHSGIQPPDDF